MSNFFDLLALPQAWEMDSEALQSSYLTQQRLWHPDRFVGKPESQKAEALQQSALINQAYQTLLDPLKRAEHLLHLNGVETPKETVQDPELLMEVMEYQEVLMEEDPAVIQKLIDQLDAVLVKAQENFGIEIQEKSFELALKLHTKMSYLTKLKADAQNKIA